MSDTAREPVNHIVSMEEIMFTLISATQDVFRDFMDVKLLSGHVEQQIPTVDMDLIAIIGIGGHRVGYIMIGSDKASAVTITKKMLMTESVDAVSARDAFGELANNIAGAFRTKYHAQYGVIPMGLPLVASGAIRPVGPSLNAPSPVAGTRQAGTTRTQAPDSPAASGTQYRKVAAATTVKVQQKGVIIPFQTADESIKLTVMYYM